MAKIETRTINASFNTAETEHILRSLDQARKSYKRAMTQRPEFADASERIYNQLNELEMKIRTLSTPI